MIFDLISGTVTAPGAGPTSFAAVTGDSFTIRNGAPTANIGLLAMWTRPQAVGFTQLLFATGNDQVRNIRYRNIVTDVTNKIGAYGQQKFKPQDVLTIQQSGSAVAGDVETVHMVIGYDDLPGVTGRYITHDELDSKIVRLVTVEDTITATAASVYSGARALNAASDLLRGNTDYAVIGAVVGISCGALTIRGTDTGNLRAAVPGDVEDPAKIRSWFYDIAKANGIPAIPVINSSNKAGIFTEIVQDENLVAVPFSWMLAELAP